MHADHWIRSPHHHTHWPRAVDKLAATNKVEPQIPAGGRISAQSHRLNTQYWLNTGPMLPRWPSIEPALDQHPALFYRHVATGMHTPRYRQAGCERIRIWRSRMGDMHGSRISVGSCGHAIKYDPDVTICSWSNIYIFANHLYNAGQCDRCCSRLDPTLDKWILRHQDILLGVSLLAYMCRKVA